MKRTMVLGLLMAVAQAQAYDGWSSQLSHAAGGALLAAGITHELSDSPSRAMKGFLISTAASVVVEGASIARGAKASGQVLDMVSHALGSALGAWTSDRYLLLPVIHPHSVGVVLHYRF